MSEGTVRLPVGATTLELRPDRSAFWPSRQALLVADVHLGKAGHFRRHGLAVPGSVNSDTMRRLAEALAATGATTLIVLGDLFHSDRNAEWDAFIDWRAEQVDLDRVVLVAGNHDILGASDWDEAGVEVVERWDEAGLTMTHAPEDHRPDFGVHLCGHVHPGVRLQGGGKQSLTVACWWRHRALDQLVFPAFGGFTGKHRIAPAKGDAVYLPVADRQVIEKAC